MKYWLIAVSSAVRTSLSVSMILGLPCMDPECSRARKSKPQPFGPRLASARSGDGQPDACAVAVDEVFHRIPTTAATARRSAQVGDLADRGRAAPDGLHDRPFLDGFAVADDRHAPSTCPSERPVAI